MIITLKGANFSLSNIGTLSTWRISTVLGVGASSSNSVTSVDRESNTGYTTTITIAEGYELGAAGITVTMGGVDITSITVSGLTITIPTKVTGNVVIKVPTKNISTGEEEEPVNYIFTINPNPASATVTLSAIGYSDVSGTGSQSITVANGTKISWSVGADGYTTRTGTWTVNGENKTESIILSEAPAGNLMDVKSRLDANTEFVSGTNSTTQWGPFRGATPTVDGDCVKISCADATQSLAGIRMGVPASVSALPVGTKVKITFSYRHDESYTPANEYKFYTSSAAASFAFTTEWKQFSQTYTWNNDWDRLQISSATTLQKEAIFYVKDFSITVVS